MRSASQNLREALARPPEPSVFESRRSHADEMTRALADRDRQLAEVQREADERLALIDQLTKEAEDRLTALDQTTAEAERLQQTLMEVMQDHEAIAAENEQLRIAAQERLELLEANDRAYQHFKATVRGRLAEITDMIV